MRTGRAAAGVLALLAISWASPAAGGTVAWQVSGTIDLVSDTVFGGQYGDGAQAVMDADLAAAGLVVGAAWSARVYFDPDAVGTEIDTGLVQFTAAGTRFDFASGGYSASSGMGTSGEADLLGPSWGNAFALLAPVSSASPQVFADSAKLVLVALADGTFPADTLPVDPPDLAALGPAGAELGGEISGTHFALMGHVLVPPSDLFGGSDVPAGFRISGSISELERVPEPSGLALGAALALLTRAAIRPRSGRAAAGARPES